MPPLDGDQKVFEARLAPPSPDERVRTLISALRRPMPERFTWNFAVTRMRHGCGTVGCAWGLALELGLVDQVSSPDRAGAQLGMSPETFAAIFGGSRALYGDKATLMTRIMPTDVADQLEIHLLEKEGVLDGIRRSPGEVPTAF